MKQKDIDQIRQIIKEEIKSALTIPVRYERRKDIKTGQPLATPEIEMRDLYIPDFIVEYLPYTEGAIRGVQEQMCTLSSDVNPKIEAVANVLIQFENSLKCVAAMSDRIKQIENDKLQIEDKDESNN